MYIHVQYVCKGSMIRWQKVQCTHGYEQVAVYKYIVDIYMYIHTHFMQQQQIHMYLYENSSFS